MVKKRQFFEKEGMIWCRCAKQECRLVKKEGLEIEKFINLIYFTGAMDYAEFIDFFLDEGYNSINEKEKSGSEKIN